MLATDWAADAVAMTARNAAHNGLPVDTAVFRWDADPAPLGPPWPLVLARPERLDAGWAQATIERTWRAQAKKRTLKAWDAARKD